MSDRDESGANTDAEGATDERADGDGEGDAPALAAARYPDGSITYPPHPVGPGGEEPVGTVDLSGYEAEIVTWTRSTATPPGVREPNALAVVEFDVDGQSVRAVGQLTSDDVALGDAVEAVYCEELRDPEAGIREAESQEWDGFRFRPV